MQRDERGDGRATAPASVGDGRGDSEPSPYTLEFEDGRVRAWYLTAEGAVSETERYDPSVYVGGPDDALDALRAHLADDPKVVDTGFEERYPDLHAWHASERERLLRVDVERVGEVGTLAHEIRGRIERERLDCAPGTLRLFDVDLDPGFRYCLDRGLDPTPDPPERDLRTLEVGIDDLALANEELSGLRVDGERVAGGGSGGGGGGSGGGNGACGGGNGSDPAQILESLAARLDREDPDVLVLSHGDLVPLLAEAAERAGFEEFHLGRRPGWTKLAGESTYASYGQVGHSPARYRVPGRAIVDESNSFLWHQSGLAGLRYMVESTGRPLQEVARGSIGTLLTSRQIRLARDRDVLAPWNKWEPETFKSVRTLHAADRGGFTFAPEVGYHEDVHEIDFASLYPRIITEYNVSPETVDCDCEGAVDGERDRGLDRVPELGYHVCEREGFLPAVLGELLADRAAIKARLRDEDANGNLPADEAARLRGESGAIKWVLVSCFGYQGYRNAKFGRIECHEAINAYAREILLDAKDRLEAGGWRVVHGIVDSLWVAPREGVDPEPIADVIADVSERVGIPLEHDGAYEWVCFVPLRESARRSGANETGTEGAADAGRTARVQRGAQGALTRYFGKRADGAYKFRGIELRQRSTPPWIADRQREFVEALDDGADPAAVCDRLRRRLATLRSGAVAATDLAITRRVSKPAEAYRQETHAVAALRRYEALGTTRRPGQSVEYVVVDDGARRTRERVRLAAECDAGTAYDADYYARLLVRAAESVCSPFGWDRTRIRRYLDGHRTVRLSAFDD